VHEGSNSALGVTLAVMENDTFVDEPGIDEPAVDKQLIEDELLVEEISIDGMCGVY
jgi:mycofactocin precursor